MLWELKRADLALENQAVLASQRWNQRVQYMAVGVAELSSPGVSVAEATDAERMRSDERKGRDRSRGPDSPTPTVDINRPPRCRCHTGHWIVHRWERQIRCPRPGNLGIWQIKLETFTVWGYIGKWFSP